MTPERRRSPRRRTLMGATARFAVLTGTMTCVVRNLSSTGARLELEHTLWIPGRFELDVPHLDRRLGARVVWRQPHAMGIAFEERTPKFLRQLGIERSGMPGQSRSTNSIRTEERVLYLEKERARLEARVKQLTDEY